MEKNDLISGLNKILKSANFKVKGTLWSKSCDDFSLIVNLRKSRWSNKYYLEIGLIFIKDQAGKYLTGAKNLNLNIAVNHLIPDLGTNILDPILDLNISTNIKFDKGLELLKEKFIPYLEKMTSLDEIRKLYSLGNFKAAYIDKEALEIIGNS